jgi:hypothetical protein
VKEHEIATVANEWGRITGDPMADARAMERRLRWWLGPNPAGEGVLAAAFDGAEMLPSFSTRTASVTSWRRSATR